MEVEQFSKEETKSTDYILDSRQIKFLKYMSECNDIKNKSFEKVDLINTFKYYSIYKHKSEEEEHKIEKWSDCFTYAYSTLFKKLIIHKDDFKLFMKFDPDCEKELKNLMKLLSNKAILVKSHKIISGDFYFKNQSSNIFERYFSKAKEWFVGNSYEHDANLIEDARNYLVSINYLKQKCSEVVTHINLKEDMPIISLESFKELLQNVFGFSQLEKDVIIKHLYFTKEVKFTDANIQDKRFQRKVMLFAKDKADIENITEQQLMKFEFEHNINELKCAIKQSESRKNLIEKEVEQIVHEDKEEARYKLKQSLLFEILWIKLTQSCDLIQSQFQMLTKMSSKIPAETFQILVLKSREDLLNYDDCSRFIFDPDAINIIPDIKLDWIENELRTVENEVENCMQDYIELDLKSSYKFSSFMQTFKTEALASLTESNKENKVTQSDCDSEEFNFRASKALSISDYRGSIAIKLDDD